MGGAHHRLEGGLAAGKRCVLTPKLLQTSSDLANAGVPMSWRHICECASQVLHGRPEHRPPARRALDGAAAGLNVIVIVGAQAEGVGWARAHPSCYGQGSWARTRAGGCAQQSPCLCRAACSICFAPGPCACRRRRANLGQGPVRGYGMSRAQNAKVYWQISFYTS